MLAANSMELDLRMDLSQHRHGLENTMGMDQCLRMDLVRCLPAQTTAHGKQWVITFAGSVTNNSLYGWSGVATNTISAQWSNTVDYASNIVWLQAVNSTNNIKIARTDFDNVFLASNYFGSNTHFLGGVVLSNSAGTKGQVFTSGGTDLAPYWAAAGTGSASTNISDQWGYLSIPNNVLVTGIQTNMTPLTGLQFVISTNAAAGVAVVPPLCISNGYVGIRTANPLYQLHLPSGQFYCGATILGQDNIQAGNGNFFYWIGRTYMSSPANGSFKLTDATLYRDRMYVHGLAKGLTAETETPLFYIQTAGNAVEGKGTNVFCGGTIDYTIHSTDATYGEVKSGIVTYEAVNPAGVWTNKIVEVGGTAGYTTAAWTMVPRTSYESTNIQVCVNVNPALTPAANRLIILWQVRADSTNTIVAVP